MLNKSFFDWVEVRGERARKKTSWQNRRWNRFKANDKHRSSVIILRACLARERVKDMKLDSLSHLLAYLGCELIVDWALGRNLITLSLSIAQYRGDCRSWTLPFLVVALWEYQFLFLAIDASVWCHASLLFYTIQIKLPFWWIFMTLQFSRAACRVKRRRIEIFGGPSLHLSSLILITNAIVAVRKMKR